MNVSTFNALNAVDARQALKTCCGADAWVNAMLAARPFTDLNQVFAIGERSWKDMGEPDWLQAFEQHPRIGDLDTLAAKYKDTADWAADEQSHAQGAAVDLLRQLKSANDAYYEKFGFIFIIFATGKTAREMLVALHKRLENDREVELRVAAAEQWKITRLRLEKLP